MRGFVKELGNAIHRMMQRGGEMEPRGRNTDWIPPVLGATHWSSGYFLGRAYRDSIWYFARQDDPEGR